MIDSLCLDAVYQNFLQDTLLYISELYITSTSIGITQLVDHIENLAPQCPQRLRSESQMIKFLLGALIWFDWTLIPVSNIDANLLSFTAFVA